MHRFSIIAILLICLACKTTKEESAVAHDTFLLLGQGGGFTGRYEEYIIHKGGSVEKWNEENKTTTPLGKLDTERTRELFKDWDKLNKQNLRGLTPGNMNYRISYVAPQGETTIKWSDAQVPNPQIVDFFKKYYALLRAFDK